MDCRRNFKESVIGLLVAALPLVSQANVSEVGGAPESTLRHGDALLVANVGAKLEPTAKDGDGYISLVRLGGETTKDMFEGKVRLDAPKGMDIHEGVLYV